MPEILRRDGGKIALYRRELGEQIIGVNTPDQLALTERYLMQR